MVKKTEEKNFDMDTYNPAEIPGIIQNAIDSYREAKEDGYGSVWGEVADILEKTKNRLAKLINKHECRV